MADRRRVRLEIEGIVQGVGFRPFLHRLAARLHLGGWCRNTTAGVTLELEGDAEDLAAFRAALRREAPPLAVIERVRESPCPSPLVRQRNAHTRKVSPSQRTPHPSPPTECRLSPSSPKERMRHPCRERKTGNTANTVSALWRIYPI